MIGLGETINGDRRELSSKVDDPVDSYPGSHTGIDPAGEEADLE
jgi:hypothetical protein